MASIVFVIIYFVSFVGGYSNSNGGLTTIPGEIPNDETTVDLSENKITFTDSSLLPSTLKRFNMKSNQLTSFPNLTNIAATLEILQLSNNSIEVIDPPLLNALTTLRMLELWGNQLTYFPDVPGPGSSLTYLSLSVNNLGTFPLLKQIGASLKELILKKNNIKESDFRVKLFADQLTKLQVSYNEIGEIPLLHHDVKASITMLDVASCGISAITEQQMRGFYSLEILNVNRNNFSIFPDLSAVASTLTKLHLSYNNRPMRAFGNLLQKFTKITKMVLKHNLWHEFPNFCHMKFPTPPTITLAGDLSCDCHTVWLKVLNASRSRITMTPNQPCNHVDQYGNKDWRNVPMAHLKCEGMYRESFTTAIDTENYYCASAPVASRIQVSNKLECYMQCTQEPSCIYFNIDAINGTSDLLCSITDITKADLSQPGNFTTTGTWYSVD